MGAGVTEHVHRRTRIGVLFGGRSGEHDVSLRSAESIMRALDPERYEVVPIGITREGRWLRSPDPLRELQSGTPAHMEMAILADPGARGLVTFDVGGPIAASEREAPLDVVIPALHGPYGEDGTIQGLLEIADVPYVGAGVLGSALGMDKALMKTVLRAAGIPVIDWVSFRVHEWAARPDAIIVDVEATCAYPCFVKPANLGSSVGITKASDEDELRAAIDFALTFDRKVIVERAAIDCREIECSVLGNQMPIASVLGEIVPDRDWYDYDAKYANSKTELIIPAQVSPAVSDRVRAMAVDTFKAIDCEGMARVDFFVARDELAVWVNELNTIPGFTSISMFAKLWEATGLDYPKLLDELIRLAIERHGTRSRLKTGR
ncbi:MAG: D-alanine--D-alanine ligase [Chloroflexota bacterium]|nr:MAG: D-alanine--D-alanine ligase [Chloroflexota bacterium]